MAAKLLHVGEFQGKVIVTGDPGIYLDPQFQPIKLHNQFVVECECGSRYDVCSDDLLYASCPDCKAEYTDFDLGRQDIGESRRGRGIVEDLGRKCIRVQWGLLSEWWCVPFDITDDEKAEMLHTIRDAMGDSFSTCPLEYIEDRLFGGFSCGPDRPDRRHIYFESAGYSFLAADEGRFWANSDEHRGKTWALLTNNADNVIGDGPFLRGFPEPIALCV